MKKIGKILLLLFIVGFIVQIFYVCLSQKYEMKYQLKEKKQLFLIEESYTGKIKNEKVHYQWRINDTFTFTYYGYLNKSSKLIKNIAYYNDKTYKCIYPTFKKKEIKMDVLCHDGEKQLYYHTISGKNKKLDAFVSSLPSYETSLFVDDTKKVKTEGFVKVYEDNALPNQYIAFQNYRGIYQIQNDPKKMIQNISMYKSDVYEPVLSGIAGKYFITADYEDKYKISTFYLVDLVSGEKREIRTSYDISYDSYIQGSVGNAIYLFDITHQRQYKINTKKKKVTLESNKKTFSYYNGEKWEHRNIEDAVKEKILFKTSVTLSQKGYERVEKVGTDKSGYYYYYKKVGNEIEVSRAPISSKESRTYLFKISSMRNITYQRDFIYFLSGDTLSYYSDQTGLRTLARHEEIQFNKDLNYFVYVK